jgi:hypothetical protein
MSPAGRQQQCVTYVSMADSCCFCDCSRHCHFQCSQQLKLAPPLVTCRPARAVRNMYHYGRPSFHVWVQQAPPLLVQPAAQACAPTHHLQGSNSNACMCNYGKLVAFVGAAGTATSRAASSSSLRRHSSPAGQQKPCVTHHRQDPGQALLSFVGAAGTATSSAASSSSLRRHSSPAAQQQHCVTSIVRAGSRCLCECSIRHCRFQCSQQLKLAPPLVTCRAATAKSDEYR